MLLGGRGIGLGYRDMGVWRRIRLVGLAVSFESLADVDPS
jgi:hypothetical protein